MIQSLRNFWFQTKCYLIPLFILLVGVVVSIFLLKRENQKLESLRISHVDEITSIRKNHDEVVQRIEAIAVEERRQHEENIRRWKTSLDEAQRKFDKDMEEVRKNKEIRTNVLLQTYGEDPTGMAKQVADATGFVLILPEAVK